MRIASQPWASASAPHHPVALEVLLNGPISRSDIARRLGLSAGSLTRLSTPLIESGLLVESGERIDGSRGRPSVLLDIVPESRHFIGVKLTGDGVLAVVTDLRATMIATAYAPLTSRAPEDVVAVVGSVVREVAGHVPSVTALGVGVGGLVTDKRIVRSAPFLDWTDVDLGYALERSTGLATVVENDLIAFTEYERWFGAGRNLDRFAVITLGAGVGYGLVAGGQVAADDDAGIGLVGHWPLDPFGPVCRAGHRGCAQSVLTTSAIIQGVSAAAGRTVTYDEALTLAESGEPGARRVVDDAGRGLGRLLAAVANLTMPEIIVLGGEGVRLAAVAGDGIAEGLAMDRDARARRIPLIMTSGDDTEWCRGAAVLAIQTHVLES